MFLRKHWDVVVMSLIIQHVYACVQGGILGDDVSCGSLLGFDYLFPSIYGIGLGLHGI